MQVVVFHDQGLGPLRPEKGWRPIITVSFDQQHHEIALGCDGQNPNLKRPFYLQRADPKSHVDISVWHKSQTKKKGRKRNEVASARITLGDVLKRQGQDSKAAEIRLNCMSSASKRGSNGRNKQQNCACIFVKLRTPASFASLSETSTLLDLDDVQDDVDSGLDSHSSADSSETLSAPPTPTGDYCELPDHPDQRPKTKRRRVKGYSMDPNREGELSEVSIEDDSDQDDTSEDHYRHIKVYDAVPPTLQHTTIITSTVHLLASLLPTHIPQRQDTIGAFSMDSTMSVAESTVSRFSDLLTLRNAVTDEEFKAILDRNKAEWYYSAVALLAVVTVDVAAFQMSSNAQNAAFVFTDLGRQLIACSSIFGSLGFLMAVWFTLRYGTVPPDQFKEMARDVNDTYVTFCFTARLPMITMFISSTSLVVWIISMAYQAWPVASIVLSLMIGMCFGLGWAIYLLNFLAKAGMRMGKRVRNALVGLGGRVMFWRAHNDAQGEEDCTSVTSTPMATPPPSYTAALTLSPPALHTPWHGRLSPLASLASLASPPSVSPDALPDVPDTPPMPPIRPPKNPSRQAVRCR
ncbi:hypothetical protein HWV62_14832 [Athelia sp. TMB]|nr:hypothetical protein HWV62_14832 [Athelia sp. TMB]